MAQVSSISQQIWDMKYRLKTVDGRHFISGCYYGFPEAIGKRSSDGHLYVGGVAMRVNPDGTGLTPVGHNLRNTHDMFVSSMGDVFQSDNDDPAHCRSTWLMEHGNMGYTDIRDGSRSWEEVAKTWEEPREWNKNRRYSKSHWRQNYPGTLPPGTIYGAGSPTGNVLIDGDEIGRPVVNHPAIGGLFDQPGEAVAGQGRQLDLVTAVEGEHPFEVGVGNVAGMAVHDRGLDVAQSPPI